MNTLKNTVEKIKDLLGEKLVSLYLFGSFINNPEKSGDIDFAINISKKLSAKEIKVFKESWKSHKVRIQINSYDGFSKNLKHDLDFLFVDNEMSLSYLLGRNKNSIKLVL